MRSNLFSLTLLCTLIVFGQENFDRAESAFHQGETKLALELLNASITKSPDANAFMLRAMVHESLGYHSNANEDYISAIREDAELYEAYFHYANFLMKTEENEKAVASLSLLLNKIQMGETKGVFFRRDENGIEPTQVTSLQSMESDILMKRGTAYQKLGMLEMALADMNRAIDQNGVAGNLVNRALLNVEMNNTQAALADLKRATSLSPNHSLAWYNIFILDGSIELPDGVLRGGDFGPLLAAKGVELFETEDLKEAERLFSKALELTPDDPVLLLNAGRLNYQNGQFDAATKLFAKAYKNDPTRNESLYLQGNANFAQGEFKQALRFYSTYLRTDPTNSNIWFNSGMSYFELDDFENACLCLQRASDFGMAKAAAFMAQYCTKE